MFARVPFLWGRACSCKMYVSLCVSCLRPGLGHAALYIRPGLRLQVCRGMPTTSITQSLSVHLDSRHTFSNATLACQLQESVLLSSRIHLRPDADESLTIGIGRQSGLCDASRTAPGQHCSATLVLSHPDSTSPRNLVACNSPDDLSSITDMLYMLHSDV